MTPDSAMTGVSGSIVRWASMVGAARGRPTAETGWGDSESASAGEAVAVAACGRELQDDAMPMKSQNAPMDGVSERAIIACTRSQVTCTVIWMQQ